MKIAVLSSGGLDSSILLADFSHRYEEVYPLYVQAGLHWEDDEIKILNKYIVKLNISSIKPIFLLQAPTQNILVNHWSVKGDNIPNADSSDESVFIPGRNILLLGLASIWCSVNGIENIAIGTLLGNPFQDASENFFENFSNVLSQGLVAKIRILAPYISFSKSDLIKNHSSLPLELTLTCIAGKGMLHCGNCNKCFERKKAFSDADVFDPTEYIYRGVL